MRIFIPAGSNLNYDQAGNIGNGHDVSGARAATASPNPADGLHVTPAGVYLGRKYAVLSERSKIKRRTMERRKRDYLPQRAAWPRTQNCLLAKSGACPKSFADGQARASMRNKGRGSSRSPHIRRLPKLGRAAPWNGRRHRFEGRERLFGELAHLSVDQ